jgi:hypothetical protein
VRLYYRDEHARVPAHLVTLRCQVYLKDGAIMSGVQDTLPLAIRRFA